MAIEGMDIKTKLNLTLLELARCDHSPGAVNQIVGQGSPSGIQVHQWCARCGALRTLGGVAEWRVPSNTTLVKEFLVEEGLRSIERSQ